MTRCLPRIALVALLLGAAVVQAQARVVPSAAVVCDACHGLKGEGLKALGAPRLAGLQQWYIERQLLNFRAGIRGSDASDAAAAQMKSIATNMPSDIAVSEAAAFIASLPPTPPPAPTVDGSATRGRDLYSTCVPCHAQNGDGQEATHAPRLQGASDWYVVSQLQAFRAGRRGSDSRDVTGQAMRAIAMTLPDEQALRDLAAYIGSLQ